MDQHREDPGQLSWREMPPPYLHVSPQSSSHSGGMGILQMAVVSCVWSSLVIPEQSPHGPDLSNSHPLSGNCLLDKLQVYYRPQHEHYSMSGL